MPLTDHAQQTQRNLRETEERREALALLAVRRPVTYPAATQLDYAAQAIVHGIGDRLHLDLGTRQATNDELIDYVKLKIQEFCIDNETRRVLDAVAALPHPLESL